VGVYCADGGGGRWVGSEIWMGEGGGVRSGWRGEVGWLSGVGDFGEGGGGVGV